MKEIIIKKYIFEENDRVYVLHSFIRNQHTGCKGTVKQVNGEFCLVEFDDHEVKYEMFHHNELGILSDNNV
jgi:hypothetical protein